MLSIKPAAAADLRKEKEDNARFSILCILTGIGMATEDSARQRLFELEALQISARSPDAASALREGDASHDPQGDVPPYVARRVLEAIAAYPETSTSLKSAIHSQLGLRRPPSPPPGEAPVASNELGDASPTGGVMPSAPAMAADIFADAPAYPAMRSLRIFAFDPSLAFKLDTLDLNEAMIQIPFEPDLGPGPVGEYSKWRMSTRQAAQPIHRSISTTRPCWPKTAIRQAKSARSFISRWPTPWR